MLTWVKFYDSVHSVDVKLFFSVYSRSTLHPEGAHSLEAKLHHVAALGGELMAAALEALLVEDNDLTGKRRRVKAVYGHSSTHKP